MYLQQKNADAILEFWQSVPQNHPEGLKRPPDHTLNLDSLTCWLAMVWYHQKRRVVIK